MRLHAIRKVTPNKIRTITPKSPPLRALTTSKITLIGTVMTIIRVEMANPAIYLEAG